LPIEAFHDEELDVVCAADIVNRADARMIQACEEFGFSVESAAVIETNRVVRAKNLDGYDPVQVFISGFIDFAHAALAQALDEFISSKSHTDR
jgi:hypothetical protein